MLAVANKWPNVYVNIAAWLPKYFGPNLVQFVKGRSTHTKVMFGTNGLDWGRYLEEFEKLGVQEERARAVLWETASRVHDIPMAGPGASDEG